jgi:glc operon protein GlcG
MPIPALVFPCIVFGVLLADGPIRDNAQLFSEAARTRAQAALEKLEKDRHVPVLIQTIDGLHGESLDAATLRRAREWGAPGLIILIPKEEGKIEARAHRRIERLIGDRDRRAIQDAFITGFRKGDFDAGLESGIRTVDEILARAAQSGRSVAAPDSTDSSGLIARDRIRLTLAGARKAHAAAEAKAVAMGLNVNIAVVDDGGHLITFTRMEGARPASIATAITKATTAATLRQPTGPLPAGAAPDVLLNLSLQNAAAASGGKITTLYGGVPIVVEGQVVGAVGVGGGTGDQDAAIARAGVTAITSGE